MWDGYCSICFEPQGRPHSDYCPYAQPPEAPGGPHICHAIGCDVEVHPRLLMCRRHWFQVPRPLRRAVLQHYRRGQEVDKKPSREFMNAAWEAVQWLRSKGS